jgi:hypothetical protein
MEILVHIWFRLQDGLTITDWIGLNRNVLKSGFKPLAQGVCFGHSLQLQL